MKKYLLIAAAAVLSLAACSQTDSFTPAKETEITFSVINHLQQTKATEGLTYPTGVPFGTLAWWTEDYWENTENPQNFVFMDNEKILYKQLTDGGPYVWAPYSAYYWTKKGYITFASYSPYTTATDAGVDGFSEVPVYDVTKGFVFNAYTIVDDTDVDLMWGNLAENCQENTNDVLDNQLTGSTDSGFTGVPTIFNHALCQLNFAFRAIGRKNPNVSAIKIEITDVDILNIDKSGTFTQNDEIRWASVHSETADYDFTPEGTFELDLIENTADNLSSTANYTSLGVSRILLPQSLVNTGDDIGETTDQLLTVSYTVKTKYESAPDTWATEEITSVVRLNNGTLTSWLDNRNITYRISINPYSTVPVTFDPAVVAWAEETSGDVNLNENDE